MSRADIALLVFGVFFAAAIILINLFRGGGRHK